MVLWEDQLVIKQDSLVDMVLETCSNPPCKIVRVAV